MPILPLSSGQLPFDKPPARRGLFQAEQAMSVRQAKEPLVKVTLNIYESDYLWLKQMYPHNHTTYMRLLLRSHRSRIEAQIAKAIDENELTVDAVEDVQLFEEMNLPEK